MHANLHDWIIPDWPAPAHVHALCTTRTSGLSTAPWDSCNLGDHVGDAAALVQANRQRLQQAMRDMGVPARPVFLRQIHGTDVAWLPTAGDDGLACDGAITRTPGLACTILVADCLPVLFTDRAGTWVAGAHAGWRGLAAGVIEQTLAQAGVKSGEVLAWLGPCIGPQAFEVGQEVMDVFCARDAQAARCFVPTAVPGKYLCDLAALARQRLTRAGVVHAYGNDGSAPWCTVGNPSRFFSHRRDAVRLGSSGRMAACIWLEA